MPCSFATPGRTTIVIPSQQLVAENMGVTSRSLITYLKELQKVGWLTVERRGQGKSNIYELDLKPKGFRSQK